MACFYPATTHAQATASAYTWAKRYDSSGRVVGTIAPDPDGAGSLKYGAVRKTYDTAGRPTKVESGELSTWQSEAVEPAAWGSAFTAFSSVETTYDALDRKIKDVSKGSDGTIVSVTQYSYGAISRPECSAVRMNPSVYASLPTSACTLGTAGANGPDRITKNVYDAAGQLVQVRRGVGTSLEQAYATYSYTANGKQQAVIDANGNRAELRYDGHDRLVRWVFPATARPSAYNGATQALALSTAGSLNEGDYEAYGYDASGNRTSLRKRDGTTLTYDYDGLGRMIRKLVPERSGLAATNTRDVYYGYDLAGLQTFARFDSTSGEGVANGYDALGRQTSTSSNMDGQSRQLSFVHDANGNRTKTTWPDAAYVTMTFDGLNRMSEIRDANSVALDARTYNSLGLLSNEARPGTAFDQSVSYDTIGRMSGLSITDGNASAQTSWGYTRNAASQILSESRSNDAFAYTGRYNVSRNYTTNGLNQYTAAGPASFCHDANGNLTADGSSVYLYDVENRLVEKRAQTNTTCSSLSYAGPLRASLRYDPLGRLYEVVGTATTRFLYDGDALVGEYDAAGSLLRRYVHGNDVGADDPRVWFEGSAALAANARHLYSDPRGSVVLAGDASGNALAIGSYDEYGIPGWSGSAYAPRFQYTGQAWLGEVGMYHYKARIYSPTLGRFLQTDPIGYKDQNNLYAYVGNDPVNSIDPTGMYECSGNQTQCRAVAAAYNRAAQALKGNDLTKGARAKLQSSVKALGAPGQKNGVTVSFASSKEIAAKVGSGFAYTEKTKSGISVVLPNNFAKSFDSWKNNPDAPVSSKGGNFSPQDARANALAHEGKHVDQFKRGMTQEMYSNNPTPYEIDAYRAGNAVNEAFDTTSAYPEP